MKLRYKILNSVLAVVAIAITALAFFISHNEECGPAPVAVTGTASMEAIVYRCYGSADVLELANVAKPPPAEGEVLVKVVAAAVNPLDWHYMRGEPYVMRLMGAGTGAPVDPRMGTDFAGVVESVGEGVVNFNIGDEVFGGSRGAFAEYLIVRADRGVALKPENMTFQQAASVGVAGVTAIQALRDHGKLQPGQKVLINGASGGVGTFAVQIAKSMGADVTGVCSTRNVEMVLGLGADRVIDYKKESYLDSGDQYDLILDMVGNHPLTSNMKVLAPTGRFVIVGSESGKWLGPITRPIMGAIMSPFIDQEILMILARFDQESLGELAQLMRDGKLTPVLDQSFSLDEVPAAIQYSEEGHARGKIIIEL